MVLPFALVTNFLLVCTYGVFTMWSTFGPSNQLSSIPSSYPTGHPSNHPFDDHSTQPISNPSVEPSTTLPLNCYNSPSPNKKISFSAFSHFHVQVQNFQFSFGFLQAMKKYYSSDAKQWSLRAPNKTIIGCISWQ